MAGWLRKRGIDVALVVAIWAFTGLLNGSEPWVSFDTPDSEFHASMAVFGSDVTDRAALPVYFWTRIGYIAPAHFLTQILGPMPGLEVYRLLLLAVMVACLFVTLRSFTGRFNATILTLLVGANTVLLGYLGNPYPTATVMSAIFAVIALAIRGNRWIWHFVAGGVLGWLVMTSPFGAMLGAVAYLSALLSRNKWTFQPRGLLAWAGSVAAGATFTFGALWLVGRWLFPGLDWLGTYLYWNSALNQADYIYELWRWVYDPSMLVPAMAAVIGLISIAVNPGNTGIRIGGVLALTTPAFAFAYWWFLPNNYLEIPHYQAMLFPVALSAMALIAASRLPDVPLTWTRGAAAAGLVGLSILAGHATPNLSVWQARLVAILAVVVFIVPWGKRWVGLATAVSITFASAQLLQNARDNFGVSTTRLYANAYLANEAEAMMSSATAAQLWLLAKTQPGDRILTWFDGDAQWVPGQQALLPLAAFQIWGANEAARGPTPTPDDIKNLESRKPLSIAMYGKNMGAVLTFWNALPKQWRSTPPECKSVPWPQTQSALVCVTYLNW